MLLPSPKSLLLTLSLFLIPIFGYLFWHTSTSPDTLSDLRDFSPTLGTKVIENLSSLPTLPIQEEKDHFKIEDATSDGIQIQYANQGENQSKTDTPKQAVTFPKDPKKPIEVRLDQERVIPIQDQSTEDYTLDTLTREKKDIPFYQALFQQDNSPREYLRYEGDRKTLLYAYEKDQATGEKKLKHWTLYASGTGLEEEKYQFDNVKLKINENGDAEVFYFGEQQIQNEAVKAEVAPSLLERAQKTLEKDLGNDILNNQTPEFIIPRPYYLDSLGEKRDLDWKWDEEKKTLSVSFSPESYPVALDPTLSFTAPGQSNTGSVITGEENSFGTVFTTGDLNSDGKTDLVAGSSAYGTYSGRVYIFYNDGLYSPSATAADAIITGSVGYGRFGFSITTGDINADGRIDLIVGTDLYDSSTVGAVKIFYNDGSYPSTSASADVTITGEGASNNFGRSIVTGDFNIDGRVDLAAGAYVYSSSTGRAYIFYNDGSIPTTAGTADVTITGNAIGDQFGYSLVAGDFNADGKTDLTVGAKGYSSSTGRAYIFYNDGSIPTTAGTADVTITGETGGTFSESMVAADFNFDGRTDLAMTATTSSHGRVYIFHNDGSIPTTAATADVTITGQSSEYFGTAITVGDFNSDGRVDLAVSNSYWGIPIEQVYIFYNDGSIPTTAATADVNIKSDLDGNSFGTALTSGDLNADGKVDLVVGNVYNTGRAYIFYSQNGQVNTNQTIAGNATSDQFGYAMTTGDVNADGRTDLIVGANAYSTSTGRAYIFYGDGQIPTAAGSADVTITGNATSDQFGKALITGDFDADGDTDLVVGAPGYSTNTGRAYIFYNDGSLPTTAGTADVTITGAGTSGYFGYALATGDFNSDSKTDLVVSAYQYVSQFGYVYVFNNDGSIPTAAANADAIIDGVVASGFTFGISLATGDFNSDGKIDLAIGAQTFVEGKAYIFYGGSVSTKNANSADVIIVGESTGSSFGFALSAGDFNADGRIDLAVGANGYSTNTGRVYIFYNDGSLPTTATTADVTITGEATNHYFGAILVSGDFNTDGRTDLVVGTDQYTSSTGRAYIFYNDGSYPTAATVADILITGSSGDYFTHAITTGDMNGDGRTDLIVGAYGNTSSTGKVYFYETRENFSWQIQRQAGTTPRTNVNGTGQELKITGEATSNNFGVEITTGDLNADGKTDLVIGANGYSSNRGRVYIFYNDGSMVSAAASADVAISPATASGLFGGALAVGDFNADGRADLAIGDGATASNTGQVYIFYNDGSYPISPSNADVTISGAATSNYFGEVITAGDLNSDGKTDLIVGANGYSTNTGRVYIFYNDGSIPTTAATADVTITGETTTNYFGGYSLTTGDFNADGRIDLAATAYGYSTNTGRAYVFYNDGSIPTTAATADVIITGEATANNFGSSITAGDFNADGKTDFAIGAYGYSTNTGRVYIFYNDGSIPTTAATADVTITEQSSYQFGYFRSLSAGDFNADGRTDLAAGAYCYSSCTGRAYVFYNDGSYPSSTGSADVTLTGEASSSYFGIRLTSGDINADGRTDLVVSAYNYSTGRGRVYTYTFGNDSVITGGATSNVFGFALVTGDFNADGRADLVVGAHGYSTNTGRAYVFYNDGIYPSVVASADAIITGETTSNNFGSAFTKGDFNADGKTDLVVAANDYSTHTGRVYIFYNGSITTENASGADITISGAASNAFGTALAVGDLNSDGKGDLIVGTSSFYAFVDKAYIFYNDGSIPTTAATADVTITGDSGSYFGNFLETGDFNFDGGIDLAVSAYQYSTATGRVYLFYGDGSLPTTAGTADVTITGEATSNNFGASLVAADFNTDGRTDLAVGASAYSANTGRAYVFYNDGSIPTTAATADVTLSVAVTGTAKQFGTAMIAGDFDANGKVDLVISAPGDVSGAGRVYEFLSGSTLRTATGVYDRAIDSQSSGSIFGRALAAGDLNADGVTDLVIGDYGYSTSTGRVYIFTSETAAATVLPATSSLKGTGKLKGSAKLK